VDAVAFLVIGVLFLAIVVIALRFGGRQPPERVSERTRQRLAESQRQRDG
jgi:hypothetical protein